ISSHALWTRKIRLGTYGIPPTRGCASILPPQPRQERRNPMRRALYLFVPSLTGCVLVASLVSICLGVYGPPSVPAADGSPLDTVGGQRRDPSRVQIGIASWDGRKFQRRRTASGERYNMSQPTAAHRTVPLGTQAVVTNLANGRTVRVRINDRGPHTRHRLLDLSYAAARQLAMVRTGIAMVQVEFLETVPCLAPRPGRPSAAWREPPRILLADLTRQEPPGVAPRAPRRRDLTSVFPYG